MRNAPTLYHADAFARAQYCDTLRQIGNRWYAARPLGVASLRTRFALALGVFFGVYDALVWEEDRIQQEPTR